MLRQSLLGQSLSTLVTCCFVLPLAVACSGGEPETVLVPATLVPATAPADSPSGAEELTTKNDASASQKTPGENEATPSTRSLSPKPLIDLSSLKKAGGDSSATAGELTFVQISRDFGSVDDSKPLEFDYAFTNTGTGPIEIVKVKASCGCMTTELAKTTFLPGEGDVIKLEWEPKGRGRQSKTIDVITSSKDKPRFKLNAVAKVNQLVKITPIPSTFGDVSLGDGASFRLFANSADPAMVVLGVKSSDAMVSATYMPGAGVGKPEHQWVIDAKLNENAPKRRISAKLTIELEVYSAIHKERVRYSMEHTMQGSVVGKLKAEPFAFLVGLVPPGGNMSYSLNVLRLDGQPFNITKAEIAGCMIPGLSVRHEPILNGVKKGYRLTISGPVGEYVGPLGGAVRIETDVPEDAKLTFPIMGKVGVKQK